MLNKRRVIYSLVAFGYFFLLLEWFVLYYTFLIAWNNDYWVIIHINNFNEALFEFILFPIATGIGIVGFIYLFKIIFWSNFQKKETLLDKYIDEEYEKLYVKERRVRRYSIFFSLGLFLGFFIAEVFIRVFNYGELIFNGVHIHHLYWGIGGFLLLLFIFYNAKGLTVNQNIFFALLCSFCLGVALHDIYLHIFFVPFEFYDSIDIRDVVYFLFLGNLLG